MRRFSVLVALGFVFITGAWWTFFITPQNGRITELGDELNFARDTEMGLMGQIARLEAISEAEVEYLAALGRLDALIPERPLLETFIEEIAELTAATGVEIETISPQAPQTPEASELREMEISMQIEGEFFELLGFLFGLNDMERLVTVDAVTVASFTDGVGETMLSAGIEMKLFALADVLPLVEVDPALEEPPPEGEAADGVDVEAAGVGS